MRILFIASDTKALGGIQQYNRKFIKVLKSRGDRVYLIELKKGDIVAKIFFVIKSVIGSLVRRPDLIICAHINYSPLGLFAKKIFKRKYIICTHGVDAWNIQDPLKVKAVKNADLVTTVSEYTRDRILEKVPDAKIYLLYNSVDHNVFVPKGKPSYLIDRYDLKGKKIIFTVARLLAMEGYKGYDRVIEAMPRILETVPDAVYVLAGKGNDTQRVKELINKMGLEDKVIMTGFVPDEEIVDFYNLADVFVMPSKAEGAPAVYVEALACGIPVVAGNKDGSSTPLMGGKLGLLIDPESIDEIASAISDVLTGRVDKKLLDPVFLREKVAEKFGLHRFPERINEAIELAVKG